MSKHFGKTWWGGQWLNSLANIDYDNRLPRGSAYARNGSIAGISIEGNTIRAKVKGSQPKPYDVTIVIPPFFEPETKKLIKAISEKPVIVSKLLNRELDAEILDIAGRCGLKVFPRQWTDFKMQCSCPDWAVPCKHLAAVVYKISAEIDNNPFLVFNLHRIDLAEEFKKENIHITEQGSRDIPLLENLLNPDSGDAKAAGKPKQKIKEEKDKERKEEGKDDSAYQKLSFSTLIPIHEPLIQLLADEPVFYQNSGNFREKYALALNKAVRNAQRIISGKADPGAFFGAKGLFMHMRRNTAPAPFTAIDHHAEMSLSINSNDKTEVQAGDKKMALTDGLLSLWHIKPGQLPDHQPSVAALHSSMMLALNLVATGAIVPQLIRLSSAAFVVRWLPAMLSKEVKQLVEKLQTILPAGMLQLSGKPAIAVEKDTAIHLLSTWLNMLVKELAENKEGDIYMDMFFSHSPFAFSGPGQQSLAGGIRTWLHLYYLAQSDYKPVIVVEELRNEHFQVNINIQESSKPLDKPAALADVLVHKKYEKSRFDALRPLARLSAFIPGLDEHINSKGAKAITMDTLSFTPFLMQAIPAIQLLDINILLPKSLQQILKPKASIRVKRTTQGSKGFLRLDKLLDFDWQVAIGDTVMDEKSFQQLMKHSEGLIKYKTGYIYVSASDMEKLHKHFSASKNLSAFEVLRSALSNDYYGASVSLTDEVQQLIKELTTHKDIPLPREINASLRPYQARGYSWIYRNMQIGFGSVLADDMGLGKTLQVITALLKFKEEAAGSKRSSLIVAPTGLLTNWQAELDKFAPSLKYEVYHGATRDIKSLKKYDVLLTSYGIARSDADKLKKINWQAMVIDEAQNIKNQDTGQSKAIKSIPADTYIAMSGTPVENRLSELWSIMDFSNRGFLGGLPDFKEAFATPIQNQNDMAAAQKLKTITSPFMMRRLKSDKSIISDLPDKIEFDCFANLAKEQASLYEKTLQKALEAIEEVNTSDQKSLFIRQGLVLQMILALKQICNHPTQFLKNNVMDAALSGKIDLLFAKLDSIHESNEKVLIFTQFTEMGNLLKRFIAERFGEEPLFYHGGCSIKQRKEMVDGFQNNRADKFFILSLKAAGTGLNLTAARHVIHYDLWWNPAVEAQATDRAYRIGQKNNVMVHRFITKGTFEERINEMIQSKKALADMTVATGENWIGNLSNKELKDIFDLW
jgi:uncharacterized Zn finger protein